MNSTADVAREPEPIRAGGLGSQAGRGLVFERFEPGWRLVTASRTVTEADIAAFAGVTGDFNPLHVDEVHASRTPFRGRVAHGLLVQSIATGLGMQTGAFDGTIQALAGMQFEVLHPTRAGDTLQAELELAGREAEPARRRGRVELAVRVWNQDGKRVLQGRWVLVMAREAALAGSTKLQSSEGAA